MKAYRSIFFDFDGVIADSHNVREQGFRDVLSEFAAADVERLIVYHRQNGGLSRYHKIRYFYENILGEDLPENIFLQKTEAFSAIMKQAMVSPDILIPETIEMIRTMHGTYPMHVISGSDEQELRFICNALNISRFFESVRGSPVPKMELVPQELKAFSYEPAEVVFIGDAINDFEAADAQGIDFLGYNNPALRGIGFGYLETMRELGKYIRV